MTMQAKFGGRCGECGIRFEAGTTISWSREKGARHVTSLVCNTLRAEQAAKPVVAPVAVMDGAAIVAFLTAAKGRGLKAPKARFLAPGGGELRLSMAGSTSRYPGAIQVKRDSVWVGRVNADGSVVGLAGEMLATVQAIAANPVAAAAAYGALMGRCSFCNLTLTDEGSVEVGYGPVCAKNWGLPHAPKGTRAVAVVPVIAQQDDAASFMVA